MHDLAPTTSSPGAAAVRAPDAGGGAAPGLPEWDLSDLYPGPDSAGVEADLAAADAAARSFADNHAGKLAEMTGPDLASAIAEYERIEEVLGRLMSYAQLLFSGDSTNAEIGRFYQTISERVTAISSHLIFFTLELNRLDDAALQQKLADPAAARWRPWLRDLRVFRPHQLSDELERLLHEKEVTGRAAWSRLFDETVAAMRIPVNGEQLTVTDALNKLSDRDRAVREAAGRAVGATFGENIRLFALVTNTLAKDKEIDRHVAALPAARQLSQPLQHGGRRGGVRAGDGGARGLPTPVAPLLCDEGEVARPRQAAVLGPQRAVAGRRRCRDRLGGRASPRAHRLRRVQPQLAKIGGEFFDRPWIDATLRPGKSGGAFAHPTVPSAHPYLLVNYHGKTRDVMTLAHELGHGVHQVLAAGQGYLMSGTPLTLAETASVFGEMLTFRAMLDAETDSRRRRIMLASKVEDMLNTVVRQTAFYQFETLLHDERRGGELVPERIGELWMKVQTESLGPAFEFTPDYKVFWSYIPHFIHSPFYVYAYAFGDCLVNALYSVFQSGHPGFQAKYLDMLRAGGTKRHKELLAPFGLDASEPAFWTRGLDVIAGFIDELEHAG